MYRILKLRGSIALVVLLSACGSTTDTAESSVSAATAEQTQSPAPVTGESGVHPDGAQIKADAQRIFDVRFAGTWVQHKEQSAPIVYVGVVDLTAGDRKRWARSTSFGKTSLLTNETFSMAELEKYKRAASAYLSSKDADCLIGILVESNKVRVVVPKSAGTDIREGLYKIVPSKAIAYSQDECPYVAD